MPANGRVTRQGERNCQSGAVMRTVQHTMVYMSMALHRSGFSAQAQALNPATSFRGSLLSVTLSNPLSSFFDTTGMCRRLRVVEQVIHVL